MCHLLTFPKALQICLGWVLSLAMEKTRSTGDDHKHLFIYLFCFFEVNLGIRVLCWYDSYFVMIKLVIYENEQIDEDPILSRRS